MTDHIRFLTEIGEDIGHLIKLARDPNDPQLRLLFEEIEQLSTDNAKSLLAALIVTIGAGATFPKR